MHCESGRRKKVAISTTEAVAHCQTTAASSPMRRNILNHITRLYHRLDGHTKEVINGAASSFALRITGAALAFALNVVLGRMLGATGVGLYFLALSVVTIATVLGRVGLDNALLRFTAASASSGDWVAIKGLFIKSMQITLITSSLLTISVGIFAPWISKTLFNAPGLVDPLRTMALGIVPTSLFTIVARMLQGLKRTKDGVAVLNVWAPAFCLAGAIALVPIWGVQGAVTSYAIAATLTTVIAWWRWHKATPQLTELIGYFSTQKLFQSSTPLFWVALSQLAITLTATISLGIWSTNADVGIYGAASRIVILLNFIIEAVNSIASPKFSALHQQGDMRALRALTKSSTKLLIIAATPAFAVFFLIPDKIIGIFGSEFTSGATVIMILAAGQLVNIITGPAGNVLMMCGYERLVRNAVVISALICITISLLLIPQMGMIGAAIANSVTVVIENLIIATLAWKKVLRIRP
jgi:O-antigen/teichoic acid export membrane protein